MQKEVLRQADPEMENVHGKFEIHMILFHSRGTNAPSFPSGAPACRPPQRGLPCQACPFSSGPPPLLLLTLEGPRSCGPSLSVGAWVLPWGVSTNVSLNNPQFSKPTEGGPGTESVEGTGAPEHKLFEGPCGRLEAVVVVFDIYKPRRAMTDARAPAGEGQKSMGAPKPKIIKGPHDKHNQCSQQVTGQMGRDAIHA